ncbi:MAG: VirK/YbjX family protein [Brucellaceae bacterium]|nr:VirK/YbjX family protein [Brucellaceae bacterium]
MTYHTAFQKAASRSSRTQYLSEQDASLTVQDHAVTYSCVMKRVLGMGLRVHFRKAAAFTLRLLAYPRSSLRWYGFLADFAGQHRLGLPHDDLIRKAIPNFFLYKASLRERACWLKNHFAIAGQVMMPEDLQRLWQGGRVHIGSVAGKRDCYDLILCLSDHAGARHEGGFTISLYRRRDKAFLHMLSFIFTNDSTGNVTLAIGGFQGAKGEDAKRSVIDATRDLYGVRPKDALLLVAEGMAAAGGSDHFMAIDNDSHVINFRHSARRGKMMSDLNHYWAERGGEPAGRFGYVLPLRNADLSQATAKRDLCKSEFLLTGRQMVMAGHDTVT